MNLLNSSGNYCLFIVVQVIQTIVTEFAIFNLQNIFTTEFESVLASILKKAVIRLRPHEDCLIIASTSSWGSLKNIHYPFGK